MKPKVILIAACDRQRVIGRENQLPWKLPDDLKRFRALTRGHAVIMGRKTFESIGRPLPDRLNLVITRNSQWNAAGVTRVGSLEAALELCAGRDQVYVIGGGEIYREALPVADRLELTLVDADVGGDAVFPDWSQEPFRETARVAHAAINGNEYPFSFLTLER